MKPAPPGTNARMFRSCDLRLVAMDFVNQRRLSRPAHQFRNAAVDSLARPCNASTWYGWLANKALEILRHPRPDLSTEHAELSLLPYFIKPVGERSRNLRVHSLLRLANLRPARKMSNSSKFSCCNASTMRYPISLIASGNRRPARDLLASCRAPRHSAGAECSEHFFCAPV